MRAEVLGYCSLQTVNTQCVLDSPAINLEFISVMLPLAKAHMQEDEANAGKLLEQCRAIVDLGQWTVRTFWF